jgi:hypothetical protein
VAFTAPVADGFLEYLTQIGVDHRAPVMASSASDPAHGFSTADDYIAFDSLQWPSRRRETELGGEKRETKKN